MKCKRCQCDVDGFRTLGDLRAELGVRTVQDAGDGLCPRCFAQCELCGLDLNRPLTANQLSAALTLPLTVPRPTGEPQLRQSYRLCIPCRALQDTTSQQQAKSRIGSLVLDGPDQELGAKLRRILLHFIDNIPDEEIGGFFRICAQGDMIKISKAAAELLSRLKQA